MDKNITYAKVRRTNDGNLFSDEFEDIYFSKEDGYKESLYVFFKQNNLPQRFNINKNFTIFETGFGTGLNFLIAMDLWQQENKEQKLHFVSVEKYLLSEEDMRYAWQFFPEKLTKNMADFFEQYKKLTIGLNILEFKGVKLSLFVGDIQDFLPQISIKIGRVDSWFLDGFAPSKNKQMWQENLFKVMAETTVNNGTFATFTAAGFVRRGLIDVGFKVEKAVGFGKKREMLKGVYYSK